MFCFLWLKTSRAEKCLAEHDIVMAALTADITTPDVCTVGEILKPSPWMGYLDQFFKVSIFEENRAGHKLALATAAIGIQMISSTTAHSTENASLCFPESQNELLQCTCTDMYRKQYGIYTGCATLSQLH